jgi:uncharacterized Zn-binding protein involved in type VI secretion
MSGAGRVIKDSAGGVIVGVMAPSVFIDGVNAACRGAAVLPHGKPPHSAAVMIGASSSVFCEGKALCRTGDSASCGHTLRSGSSTVFSG